MIICFPVAGSNLVRCYFSAIGEEGTG